MAGGDAVTAMGVEGANAPRSASAAAAKVPLEVAAEEEEAAALPPRMGECQVCSAGAAAKYRCPACATATCSLVCSKAHKGVGGDTCSGKRDRAAFKDIREFTDADVVNDYRFLEDALSEKDRAKRWRPSYVEASAERPAAAAKVLGRGLQSLPL